MAIFVEVRPFDNKRDAMVVFRWRSDQLDRTDARFVQMLSNCCANTKVRDYYFFHAEPHLKTGIDRYCLYDECEFTIWRSVLREAFPTLERTDRCGFGSLKSAIAAILGKDR